jgi:hypothetical protein
MNIPIQPARKQVKKVEKMLGCVKSLYLLINFVFVIHTQLKNLGILVLGGGLLWYFLRKGAASNQLKWQVMGLDIKRRTISIDLINPTNTPLKFSALVSDIKANGAPVGLLDYRQPTTIAPLGKTKINIPMKLNALGVLQFISQGLQKIKSIEFTGTLNAEGLSIPFNEIVKLND